MLNHATWRPIVQLAHQSTIEPADGEAMLGDGVLFSDPCGPCTVRPSACSQRFLVTSLSTWYRALAVRWVH